MDPQGAYVARVVDFYSQFFFSWNCYKNIAQCRIMHTGHDCTGEHPCSCECEYVRVSASSGNLLTSLLLPYFSLVSLGHVKDGWAPTCPIGGGACRGNCIHGGVWFVTVRRRTWLFVRRNKPHMVERNCKTLFAF